MGKTVSFDLTDFLTAFFSIASVVILVVFLLGFASSLVFAMGGDHFYKVRSLTPIFIAFVTTISLSIVFGLMSKRKYKFNL